MSKRKPHNEDAGYIAERRNPHAAGSVTIYEATPQGIDTGGARYAVVCQAHATIIGETSIRGARLSMKEPAGFCDECRAIIATVEATP